MINHENLTPLEQEELIAAMTLREALDEAIEMWTFLAGYPGRDKEEWPGIKRSMAQYSLYLCALCLWTSKSPRLHACGLCPLTTDKDGMPYCVAQKSPYAAWSDAKAMEDPEVAQEAARGVLNDLLAARQRLEGI